MAEIDPVILELRAEMQRYRAELQQTATFAERSFARQDRAVRNLEKQMLRSSTAISGALRGLAGTLATAFTGRELVALLDNYTRLQNSLRVAGLEGEALASVQQRLLDLSSRYGVSINGLADLYGKIAQSQRELGATSNDLLSLTEASAQALRITGTSATAAQGALLGLTQALSSGIVRAEEFNQINEGGLRPLLQVAANTERFGGSVARLRAAVVDGKVSSQEFYAAILAGSAQLESQANKATLTLAGAFEALQSRLVVYFGEAGKGSGATQALAEAIKLLADNLDTIIPLLAIVATTMGVRYVTAMLAAAGSTGVASTALFALQARAAGAATSMEALALAGGTAGRSLLAAFGGPVGVAIMVVATALGIAAARANDMARVSDALRASHERVANASSTAQNAIDRLATAYGRAREEALSLVRAQRQLAAVEAAKAGNDLIRAENELQRQRRAAAALGGRYTGGLTADAEAAVRVAAETSRTALQNLANLDRALASPPPAAASSGPTSSLPAASGRSGGGGGGRSGPSAAEINDRFASEIYGLSQQILSSRRNLAVSADEEADLARTSAELARRRALQEVEANRDYSAQQKERLREHIERLADIEQEAIERDRLVRLEREAADLASAQYSARQEQLQGEYDLAESSAERRRIAMEILDLEFRHREAMLQSVLASETASEADKAIARATLDRLSAIRSNATESANRATEGPGEAYLRSLIRDAGELNDAYNEIAVDGLKSLNDGLTDAIMGSKSLGDVFKNVADQIISDLIRIAIQQAVIQPLANSLFGGGGGGGIGGFVGSLFGRASGGYVAPDQTVRINESAGRGQPEYFRPTGSGTIIPLGQVAQQGSRTANPGTATVRIMLSDDLDGRIAAISGDVAVEVVRGAAAPIIDASANEALRRASRPGL